MAKTKHSAKPPALILGGIPRIVIPIARSLHNHGVAVDVVNFNLHPRIRSRAVREFRRVPRPDLDRTGFVEQLQGFIRRGGTTWCFPPTTRCWPR